MTSTALMLVLLASIAHAIWNLLARDSRGDILFVWLVYTLSTIIYFPFILYGGIELRNVTPVLILVVLVSCLLRFGNFVLLQRSYREAELSVIYPLSRGSAPVLSTFGAIAFLEEKISGMSFSGLMLIVAGILIVTGLKFRRDEIRTSGLFYGLSLGVSIALYTLWDKVAVVEHDVSALTLTFSSNLLGAVVLLPFAMGNGDQIKSQVRKQHWQITGIAVLSPLSYLLVLIAMKTTDVIYIAPLREVSILFGVLLAGRLFGEKNGGQRLAGSVLIVAGIILLSI